MRSDATTQAGYSAAVTAAALAAATRAAPLRPWLVGLSGLQGSGKSTLAAEVVAAAQRAGLAALTLSIDDFYLPIAARRELARRVHPLLITRGVPGTHDIDLLQRTLDALPGATPRSPVRVPRFDKGLDTRLPPSRWRRVVRAPQLVVLEGWCVGVPPQSAAALRTPVNALERNEDGAGIWRRWVNTQLAQHYVPLWRRIERLVLLQAPDFSIVMRWRDEQERTLRRRHAPQALSPAALRRFVMHYERLSRHALRTLPAQADLRIVLDAERHVTRIVAARSARANAHGRSKAAK